MPRDHLAWTRSLSPNELEAVTQACDHCHTAAPTHALMLDTGMRFLLCQSCNQSVEATDANHPLSG